uniref:Uncharacterized protein n=1 Tax=mine drainage metagenome TaxID=410659 RepID=E6QU75_9ZZZZ
MKALGLLNFLSQGVFNTQPMDQFMGECTIFPNFGVAAE